MDRVCQTVAFVLGKSNGLHPSPAFPCHPRSRLHPTSHAAEVPACFAHLDPKRSLILNRCNCCPGSSWFCCHGILRSAAQARTLLPGPSPRVGQLRISAGKEDHAPPAGKHRFLLAFITDTVLSKRGYWEEECQVIENSEHHFCH